MISQGDCSIANTQLCDKATYTDAKMQKTTPSLVGTAFQSVFERTHDDYNYKHTRAHTFNDDRGVVLEE